MAVYMGRTVALCGNSSMYALHEQSMETRHGDWSETITAKKGFKDRDHDQYHANTSGFTGVVFAHTTRESRFRGCVFRLSALLIMKHMQQQLHYRAWERLFRSTVTARMDGSRPCG